jgi:hypothetical protein
LKPALQNEDYAHRLEEQQEAYTSKCDARRLEYKPDVAVSYDILVDITTQLIALTVHFIKSARQ